jgi:hypothetical protein
MLKGSHTFPSHLPHHSHLFSPSFLESHLNVNYVHNSEGIILVNPVSEHVHRIVHM